MKRSYPVIRINDNVTMREGLKSSDKTLKKGVRAGSKIFCFRILLAVGLTVTLGIPEASAQQMIVRSISIHGNAHFREDVLKEMMGIQERRPLPAYWPDTSMTRLLSVYHRQGFYMARIDSLRERVSSDSAFIDIEICMFEGHRMKTGRIEIRGVDDGWRQEFGARMEMQEGRWFDEALLEQDIQRILDHLENSGHPLSRVAIDSLSLNRDRDPPRMDIVLYVDAGPSIRLESIRVQGNRFTKENVILREARLKIGTPYHHKDVLSIRERLQRLGFFQEVAEPEVAFFQDRAAVTLRVMEGNSTTIDGVVGYHPSTNDRESGYFTGRLECTFRNLLGTGRFLEAYWEKKDAYSQAMRFGYVEPWLAGWPVHLGIHFEQEIRDTTYIEREWDFSVRYVPWATFSLSLKGGHREVHPDSSAIMIFDVARTRSWLVSAAIDYNTLDEPLNPSRGVRYQTTVTLGRKRNFTQPAVIDPEDWKSVVNTRLLQADAEAVFPTFRRQGFYLGLHVVEVRTGDRFVPLSDQIRFGGARTLRGYAEDAFRGTLVSWLNAEYRFRMGRYSRFFVFFDCGVYQRREAVLGLIKGTKAGYGIGLRLETRLGLIGIDYGLGEGDSPMRGKVHVGLTGRF
jgi:outer membrane protein assembly factor BamA